jgi:hypothetical protein
MFFAKDYREDLNTIRESMKTLEPLSYALTEKMF